MSFRVTGLWFYGKPLNMDWPVTCQFRLGTFYLFSSSLTIVNQYDRSPSIVCVLGDHFPIIMLRKHTWSYILSFYLISLRCPSLSSRDIACSVAGITSDANVLTNELRLIAQRWATQYVMLDARLYAIGFSGCVYYCLFLLSDKRMSKVPPWAYFTIKGLL